MRTTGRAIVPRRRVHSAVLMITSLEVDGTIEAIMVPERTPLGCYEVVQEPSTAGSDERFPVIAKDKAVWDALLDGSARVKNTLQHADSEVEDRERE
jgi:hypothetical protein